MRPFYGLICCISITAWISEYTFIFRVRLRRMIILFSLNCHCLCLDNFHKFFSDFCRDVTSCTAKFRDYEKSWCVPHLWWPQVDYIPCSIHRFSVVSVKVLWYRDPFGCRKHFPASVLCQLGWGKGHLYKRELCFLLAYTEGGKSSTKPPPNRAHPPPPSATNPTPPPSSPYPEPNRSHFPHSCCLGWSMCQLDKLIHICWILRVQLNSKLILTLVQVLAELDSRGLYPFFRFLCWVHYCFTKREECRGWRGLVRGFMWRGLAVS